MNLENQTTKGSKFYSTSLQETRAKLKMASAQFDKSDFEAARRSLDEAKELYSKIEERLNKIENQQVKKNRSKTFQSFKETVEKLDVEITRKENESIKVNEEETVVNPVSPITEEKADGIVEEHVVASTNEELNLDQGPKHNPRRSPRVMNDMETFDTIMEILGDRIAILEVKAKKDSKNYQLALDTANALNTDLNLIGLEQFNLDDVQYNATRLDFIEKCQDVIEVKALDGKFQDHRIMRAGVAMMLNILSALATCLLFGGTAVWSSIHHREFRLGFFNSGETGTQKDINKMVEALQDMEDEVSSPTV